jgi:hypothetical protein
LWRVVTENGVEVSREVINKSTYKASPRSVTVGIASSDSSYVARMQAAIATKSLDTCKSVAAAIKSEAAAAASQQQQTTTTTTQEPTAEEQQQAALEAYYNALAQQQAAAEAAGQ